MTGQTDFKIYLHTSSKEIEIELRERAKIWRKKNKYDYTELNKLLARFTDNWSGGKMLRGVLVKLGYELLNGEQTEAILQPAAAFEILHTSLLVHDDIIDHSPTRRGKTAMHIHKNIHYGISQAICLGDLGISLAGKLLAESNFPPERKNRALRYFYEMVNTTILGEMMDVASAQETKRSEEQILQIHKNKTANYTLIGPLTLGAILAGATEEYVKNIKQFAQPLGIAYQIQDDILGIFGDEKTLGKSITSDIEENKNTLLIAYAIKHANKQQKSVLANYWGKKNVTTEHYKKIKQVIIDTGSLAYSQNKIQSLTAQAKKIVPQLSKDKQKRKILTELADVLIARQK
jgi:geranylgeranyl diphosphate synthase type I